MTVEQRGNLKADGEQPALEPTPRLHQHYSSFAGICLYIGLFVIVRSIRGIAGAAESALPTEPAPRQGAILATAFIVVTSFAAAAYFYWKRPRRPFP